MKWLNRNRKTLSIYLRLVIPALLIEIFLFNLSSVRTFYAGEGVELTDRISVGEAVKCAEGGQYTAGAEAFTLSVGDIDETVENLYLDIDFMEDAVPVSIILTDEGNSSPYGLPVHYLLRGRGRTDSRYVTLHPYGKVKTIRMVFEVMPGESFRIHQIAVNRRKPFSIKGTRLAAIYGLMAFAVLFRRGSRIHSVAFRAGSKKQMAAAGMVMFTFFGITLLAHCSNIELWREVNDYAVGDQYYRLTDALLKGEFALDYRVSEDLLALENPYDRNAREEAGVVYRWDTAFYNGGYYCYFGITPVLLLYLPIRLLTGRLIKHYTVNLLFSLLMIPGSFYLVRQIIKRWGDEKVPFCAWPLLSGLLCFSGNYFFLYMRPYFYNIPITAANALTIWGMGFWIKALSEERRRGPCFLAGSICLALVAGCRPQMALLSLLAVPLFWDTVFQERKLFGRDSRRETLAFCMPYLIVAGFLMYYNYVRFGNIFEFGAKYNLTTNDMTRRGFNLDRLGMGLFTFLFQPPNIIASFPYLCESILFDNYMGKSIVEFVFGGIFMSNVITLINAVTVCVKDTLKKYKVQALVLCSLGLTLLLGCIDTTIAGILQRYTADMVFAALFPACIICCILLAEVWGEKRNSYYVLGSFLAAAFVLMLVCDFFMVFASTGEFNMETGNPEVYFYVRSLFSNL